ncbi:splicing factor 3B subunit 1-like protein [Tanacetum coccineum]
MKRIIGMTKMTPPIKELLPRLSGILKNRHEKVQENCIDLVGRIADRGAEYVPAREWMRICFELLEMLKAHKKGIRWASVNTFGYIAKAIGPQDVQATLLKNLKVQERQSRVYLEEDFMGGALIVKSDSDPVVSFRETVLEKSCCIVMSKFPNKHNRLYTEARPMEEGLAEAIDEGRIGPRDGLKVRSKVLAKEFGWDKDFLGYYSRPSFRDFAARAAGEY